MTAGLPGFEAERRRGLHGGDGAGGVVAAEEVDGASMDTGGVFSDTEGEMKPEFAMVVCDEFLSEIGSRRYCGLAFHCNGCT